MKRKYIYPQIAEIVIDKDISLRLQTANSTQSADEPGSGNAGIGGTGNGSGESGWERADTGKGIGKSEGIGTGAKGIYSDQLWE